MRNRWHIALAAFIGVSVSIAPTYLTTIGIFLKPMIAELGWSRTQLSSGGAVVSLVAVVLTPFVGVLIDRSGCWIAGLFAAISLPIMLALCGLIPASYPVFLLVAVLMGVVASFSSPSTFAAVLPQWFDKNLGLALSLCMTGLGFGTVIFQQSANFLIQNFGWRSAYLFIAAAVAVIGIANVALLFRDRPDFAAARTTGAASALLTGFTFQEALRTPVPWLLTVTAVLVVSVNSGVGVHLVALLTDRGLDTATAVTVIMALSLGSMTGRLCTGALLDRIHFAIVGGVIFTLQAVGMSFLWLGLEGIAPYVAVFLGGLALGAEVDIIPFVLRKRFGMRSFGKLFGLVFGLYQLGPVIGPMLMGISFDRTGSYAPMLLLFIIFSLVAAVCIVLTGIARVQLAPATAAAAE
jgi:MFS family permease